MKGPKCERALQLLHAFYFGATGEHCEWMLGDKISQAIMLLTLEQEARLQEFLADVIDKL